MPEHTRVLLIGQTGVGKSTELAQVAADLESKYCILFPPVDTVLDLGHIGWHEILVFSARWAASAHGMEDAESVETLDRYLEEPRETKYPAIAEALRSQLVTTIGGPPAPTPLQRFRNEEAAIRGLIAKGRAQFWDVATAVFGGLEQRMGRPPLLIIDGLEKMPDSSARQLFYDEARHVRELPVRTVVTGPLSMSFTEWFGDMEECFSSVERMRAIPPAVNDPSSSFFDQLASARGATGLISTGDLALLIHWCAGLPRQFLHLLGQAATLALEGGQEQIKRDHCLRAAQRVTERFQYQLGPSDFEALARPDSERTNEARARLLRVGALVEFDDPSGGPRIESNPLVRQLMNRRKSEAPRGRA